MGSRLTRPLAIALIALVAAGCSGPDQPSASAAASEAPGASIAPSEPGASQAPVESAEPIPSDELGSFSCDLPIVEDASVAIANIVDVRVGVHDAYDRIVFEFEQGTPELTLDRASPPFAADGSGQPVEVDGTSFLRLTMRGGSKQTDEGTSSYDGPTSFDVGSAALVHLVETGDFERQSTWVFGLGAESCVRVLLLDDPARVVIDVEHP